MSFDYLATVALLIVGDLGRRKLQQTAAENLCVADGDATVLLRGVLELQ